MDILALKNKLGKFTYYTKQNLGLALGKEGDTLDYWINKLIKQNILIPLKKGFYISVFYLDKVKGKGEEDGYLEFLAGILRYPSYVSLEYAMAKYGLIPETAFAVTSITKKTTRIYKSVLTTFSYRNVKESLFTGYIDNQYGIQKIKMATPAKALFDFLYLKKSVSAEETKNYLLESSRINWQSLNKEDRVAFRRFVELSGSKKMFEIMRILEAKNIL